MRVLAIDPGAKTGIAHIDTDYYSEVHLKIVEGGLEGFKQWYVESNRLAGSHLDAIIVESFELEEGSHGIDYESPTQIIHWIREGGLADNYFKPIIWQRRMQRGKNTTTSVPVLKRAGLYPKRGELKEGHQVAALQHALSYLIRIRHQSTIAFLHPKEG